MDNKSNLGFESSFLRLKTYIENESYKGWDPYDGLNSPIFRSSPLYGYDLARLLWIQFFKRSPVNLRALLQVPKGYNPKGIALLLSGYCNLYELAKGRANQFEANSALMSRIRFLSDLLVELRNRHYAGACWGYNFPWQARRLFLFPANTPTVVATSFCVDALLKSYSILKDESYKAVALSSADFVLDNLKRTKNKSGIIFSYSPLNGNNTVFNASLLGAKILCLCYEHSNSERHRDFARKAIIAARDNQNPDGSWVYGLLPVQKWIDSFHTGYNLEAIQTYRRVTNDTSFDSCLEKGFSYYINSFFSINGIPSYYHDRVYPIDIHCPAQLFVTLTALKKHQTHRSLAQDVLRWTINNMQDRRGFFYYQKKRFMSSKISYMRWSNAFMFRAMTEYFKGESIDGVRNN